MVQCRERNYVVEADIKGFFDNVDHEWLMKMLAHDIADRKFLEIIDKFLKAGVMENGKYLDEALYTKVRHKVEDRLWTDDMTNMQKLYKIANYICDTTHYPGKGCTDKDINPTFWNDFSVDGVELFYYLFDMPTDFKVYKIKRDKSSGSQPAHTHPYYEIFYLINGDCTFFIDHNIYKLNRGDLIVVPQGELHKSSFPQHGCSERYVLCLSLIHI